MKIGLMGYPRAGKDTVCEILATMLPLTRLAFGDMIKVELAEAFNLTLDAFNALPKDDPVPQLALKNCNDRSYCDVAACYTSKTLAEIGELPRSMRYHQRMWATQYKRNIISDRYWVVPVYKQLVDIVSHDPNHSVVITDVRHYVEIDAIEHEGFELWRVDNNRIPVRTDHESELEWPKIAPTRVIENHGTLDDLRATVTQALRDAKAQALAPA